MSPTTVVSRNVNVLLFPSMLYFLLLILLQRGSKMKDHMISFPFVGKKKCKELESFKQEWERGNRPGIGKKKGRKLEKLLDLGVWKRKGKPLHGNTCSRDYYMIYCLFTTFKILNWSKQPRVGYHSFWWWDKVWADNSSLVLQVVGGASVPYSWQSPVLPTHPFPLTSTRLVHG